MIYLDNAGTTKMFEECVKVHEVFSCENFFNPSALSNASMQVKKQIDEVEQYILKRLSANEGNVIFTGSATESNNLAVKGSLCSGGYEYVFSAGEHPSVFNMAKKLEQDGYVVHFVPLGRDGKIDIDKLKSVLNKKTRLLSVMHASNETGAVNDLDLLSKIKNELCPRAIFHVDGVQAFMKVPFSMRKTSVDLYSFSAHKIHGPKGIAGLYVRNKNVLKQQLFGGGQQYGLRPGTENVSGIMQLKKAMELTDEYKNLEIVEGLKKAFLSEISDEKGIVVHDFGGSPYIVNLVFCGVKGETMLHALEAEGVIIGLGSACSAKSAGNRILQELGFDKEQIISSTRISFSALQSEEEVKKAGEIIKKVYKNIFERVS